MVTSPSLKGLQAFEAAARTGSFAAAAEELSVSAAAVSQLIRTVEEQMGRQLFHRVSRKVVLTEAGVEMLPRLTMAFQEIGSVSRELGGDAFRPRLVVSVPPSMAMGWSTAASTRASADRLRPCACRRRRAARRDEGRVAPSDPRALLDRVRHGLAAMRRRLAGL